MKEKETIMANGDTPSELYEEANALAQKLSELLVHLAPDERLEVISEMGYCPECGEVANVFPCYCSSTWNE